ncbi:hypothetical protein V8G69_06620 [Gaetbulibacter sp. M235]|uniref:hypothetical protein n=1 Tax=Gaetbulibacter sp. M235 TaxID=3126510 RepID=UPI00374F6AD7
MKKLSTILVGIVGILSIIFLVVIIGAGDDAIKAGESSGAVNTFMYLAYAILIVTIALVLVFTLKGLFTNSASLKSALIGAGAFLAVLVISYAVSGGDTREYLYGGVPATDGESHMVGAGIVAFYILMAGTVVAMLLAGVKKLFNK